MRNILILLFSISMVFSSMVYAEETVEEIKEAEPEGHVYHYPEIKPEFLGLLGYRYISLSGSEKAGEFEYPHSSPVIGGEIRLFPLPHRFHLEADMLNKKDYFIDAGYAYGDIVLFRDIHRALFHNLDNISLIDLNTATANPGVSVRDEGTKYGVKGDFNNLNLRLKTPDFPFHIYMEGKFINKRGDMQQRFMGGSAYFNNSVRVSQKKDIDWSLKDITIGTNSHLGPFEVDLSHNEKRFHSKGDRISSEYYTVSTSTPARAAGTYPHNLIPDIKSSTNTIKLHTSYTGRVVASTTLSQTKKENKDSGAKADYFDGSVEVVYIPFTMLTLVARYKHKEADLDNPTTIPAGYLGYSSYTTSLTGIRPSLSFQSNILSGAAKIRLFKGLGLNAEYYYEEIDRKNADQWKMAESTTVNRATVSANARLIKNLTLKAKYSHLDVDNPAHNTQPDRADSGNISMSWHPFTWTNVLLGYNIAKEKKHGLHYVTSSGAYSTVNAENRTASRERLFGSITLMPLEKLSVTPSYIYMHNKIVQDLSFNDAAGNPQLDRDVAYKDTARGYALNINYAASNNVNVNADASQTKGKGSFYPGAANAVQPVSVASFSEMKIKETGYAVGGDYKFLGGWIAGLKCRYHSFKDLIDNPYDDAGNGIVRIILLTISKKW